MTSIDLAAALRVAAIDFRTDLPLSKRHNADFGLRANNQLVALVAVPVQGTAASWARTNAYLSAGLPVFAVPDRDATQFVKAWASLDAKALERWRVPLRAPVPSC